MKQIRNFAIILLTTAVVFIGCFTHSDVSEVSGPANNSPELSKISLPVGATLDSAVFSVNVTGDNTFSNLTIHRITSGWTELGVTWNTQPTFEAVPSASFTSTIVDGAGWFNVDVTNLVQYWLNNPLDNFGLLLMQDNEIVRLYHSSEFILNPAVFPKLTVYYNGNQSITIQRGGTGTVIDSWIWSLIPDQNYGDDIYLRTINFTSPTENYLKYSLFQFDYEVPPTGGGCTLTPGYWKTHSIYGPAPYNPTWALIGEDTPFFLSGMSYYQTLWTPPAGNAYYNLSFHYIAAQLNFLNGADPSSAQAAFDAATILFNTYTPAQIKALKGNNPLRAQFINLAGILGSYNEGIIGPGHCD